MNAIIQRPDYLRFNPQIRADLEVLASYKRTRVLKVTDQGFKRVSAVHALFQKIKGKLGFTDYCAKGLVNYHARKLLYEVNIVGAESFSDLLNRIKNDGDLTKRYKRMAALFIQAVPEHDRLKIDLTAEYMHLKPCFWKRVFLTMPQFNPTEFGRSALDLPFVAPSFAEGLHHFARILKMNPSDALLASSFKNSFDRYVKQHQIPHEWKQAVAQIQLSIGRAQYNLAQFNQALDTHQGLVAKCEIHSWSPELITRCFNNLIHCKDDTHFIAFYRKAMVTGFPCEPFHAHLIKVAIAAPSQNALFELAFEQVNAQEITTEFAEKWLDSTNASKEKLSTFFRLRQKAPHSVSEIKAPWHLFQTAEEVLSCKDFCLTDEDRKELKREFRKRNNQEANARLESIGFVDKLLFRRGSNKENDALNRFRQSFKEAEGSEYDSSWLSPYLAILSKNKKLKEELHQVVSKTLVICRAQKNGIELLETVLPYMSFPLIRDHGEGLSAFIVRSPLRNREKETLIEKMLQKGPHPYLLLLKGDYASNPHVRLEAYRLAYTMAPHNVFFDEMKPYHEREMLADDQVTIEDLMTYRQMAIEAGVNLA